MSDTTKEKPQPLSVNQQQAAELLGISARTLSRWEADGKVKSKKHRRIRLYPLSTLKRLAGETE